MEASSWLWICQLQVLLLLFLLVLFIVDFVVAAVAADFGVAVVVVVVVVAVDFGVVAVVVAVDFGVVDFGAIAVVVVVVVVVVAFCCFYSVARHCQILLLSLLSYLLPVLRNWTRRLDKQAAQSNQKKKSKRYNLSVNFLPAFCRTLPDRQALVWTLKRRSRLSSKVPGSPCCNRLATRRCEQRLWSSEQDSKTWIKSCSEYGEITKCMEKKQLSSSQEVVRVKRFCMKWSNKVFHFLFCNLCSPFAEPFLCRHW